MAPSHLCLRRFGSSITSSRNSKNVVEGIGLAHRRVVSDLAVLGQVLRMHETSVVDQIPEFAVTSAAYIVVIEPKETGSKRTAHWRWTDALILKPWPLRDKTRSG
ncbi:hypothetical protein LX81_03198 [Palleronia aestuarii]|uniref:Uncharacterized protein n=1 Tax=Palleronia aestuarii TaxID=568105 RepID=A0A2W7N5U1_9RHOB|nr:hypothetical protein LX81_03198 [Palleronia aestuarii]